MEDTGYKWVLRGLPPIVSLVVFRYHERMQGGSANNHRKINHARYVWFEGYVKMIEKKHPGIKYGFETEDNSWCIFSEKGALLVKVSLDWEDQDIVYQYMTDLSGNLTENRTKELKKLRDIIPQLEAIDAFNR